MQKLINLTTGFYRRSAPTTANPCNSMRGELCRFYQARHEEEKAKAGSDERKLHKIETDFLPSVVAESAAVQGALYEAGVVSVH